MNAIVVRLKDMPGLENIDPSKMSTPEVETAVRRCFAFFPKSATIRIDGETVTIELPEAAVADAEEAVRLCERAGKRAGEGNYRKAVDIYTRALELDPGLLRARRDLAMAYVELREFDEAKDHLVEVLRLNPKDVWGWVVLANHYSKHENDYVTAENFYKRALDIDPSDAWALNGYAALKMERGEPQEALNCFAAAIASHPKFVNAIYGKALVLKSLHQLPESAETLKTLFRHAELQDARSVSVFENARRLIFEVERELADRQYPDAFTIVENYRTEVERLSGFPVRVSAEDLPDMLSGVAQIAWKHGRDHHLIKHSRAVPPSIALHLVAHELTHIRLESLARQAGRNRFFTSTAKSRELAIRSMESDIRRIEKAGYPHDAITNMTLSLFEGMCRFLFNCPLDMLIETYLRQEIPALEAAQFLSLGKMTAEALTAATNAEVRKITPRKILDASTALNGAYALFIDELNEGATNFSAACKKFESMVLSKKLLTHWKTRHERLSPGDEYDLVDEFADMLGLNGWYEWKPDAGAPLSAAATTNDKPGGTPNPELLKQKHPAAVWYLLSVLERYDKMPVEKVREIAFEAGLLGRGGLDYASSDKKYRLNSLPGEELSGLQIMCLMFAGFKRVAPDQDCGMDLDEPFLTALQMFNANKGSQ